MRQRRGQRIGADIGQFAGEDFIEHHAQGIEVGAPIDLLWKRHFDDREEAEVALQRGR